MRTGNSGDARNERKKNKMNKLENLAEKMNAELSAVGRDERWVLDDDESSNSVGTWFCGTLGGINDAQAMCGETTRLIETPNLSRNECPWFNPSLRDRV